MLMGRIKTDKVKRVTSELVEAYPDKFYKEFAKNKEALVGLAEIRSKKLRNFIAGYASRLKSRRDDLPVRPRKLSEYSERPERSEREHKRY